MRRRTKGPPAATFRPAWRDDAADADRITRAVAILAMSDEELAAMFAEEDKLYRHPTQAYGGPDVPDAPPAFPVRAERARFWAELTVEHASRRREHD